MSRSSAIRGGVIAVAVLCAFQTFSGLEAAQKSDATPRLPDGHIDLNGTWGAVPGATSIAQDLGDGGVCIYGCAPASAAEPESERRAPDRPVYKVEYRAKVADLEARQVDEDPTLTCQPPGVPRIGPPDKIIQSKDVVAFLYDDSNGAFWRIVPTDGTPHRDLEPSYLGDSIGWWEGDTLVVETINLNTETWLTDDGAFHTENLRVIERLSREGDTLHFRAIAHDPDVLAAPWELRPRELPLSDWELEEPVPCVERSLGLMEDRTLHHDNAR
jgi:hypothetical protein